MEAGSSVRIWAQKGIAGGGRRGISISSRGVELVKRRRLVNLV
jgi:hypothetical protein